jgi:hypothetical protein
MLTRTDYCEGQSRAESAAHSQARTNGDFRDQAVPFQVATASAFGSVINGRNGVLTAVGSGEVRQFRLVFNY